MDASTGMIIAVHGMIIMMERGQELDGIMPFVTLYNILVIFATNAVAR